MVLESSEEGEPSLSHDEVPAADQGEEALQARQVRADSAPAKKARTKDASSKAEKKELRNLARQNQQLMIQTALLGSNTAVAKKRPVKVDVTAFSLRLKERLMGVRGRFVPEGSDGPIALTADAEASGTTLGSDDDFPRGRGHGVGAGEDQDDELVVIAPEPRMVIEAPKQRVLSGPGQLEGIFGDEAQHVMHGAVERDPTRVWVAQLPAFAKVDLWDPRVVVVTVASNEQRDDDDGDYEPSDVDQDVELDSIEMEADEHALDAENGELNPMDGDDDAVLILSDDDAPNEEDAHDAQSSGGPVDAHVLDGDDADPFADDWDDGGDGDQRIGTLVKDAARHVASTPKSQPSAKRALLLPSAALTADAAHAAPRALSFHSASDGDDDFDLAAEFAANELVQQPPHAHVSPARTQPLSQPKSVLQATTQLPPPALHAFAEPGTPSKRAKLSQLNEHGGSSAVGPFSAAIGTAPPPHSPVQIRIPDPIERAKNKAKSALDRFLVRGDKARDLAMAPKAAAPRPIKEPEPVAADVDDADVFAAEDDELDAETGARAMVEEEAVESDDDDQEGESDAGSGGDEENPGGAFRLHPDDDDDANFPQSSSSEADLPSDSATPVKRARSVVEQQLEAFNANTFAREDADLFSAESDAEEPGTPRIDAEGAEAEVAGGGAGMDEEEEEDSEQARRIERLRMEKDLAELNRIKDLYVLGQWKTEKLANRKQMGMEDYVDDEFQPAWNSIYNRDLIRHKLHKPQGDDNAGAAEAEAEAAKPKATDDDDLLGGGSDSDGEEEYLRKREKLKQSLQLQRVASIFEGGSGSEMSRAGSFVGGLSRGASMLDGMDSLAGVLDASDSVLLMQIDNRREAVSASAVAGGGGAFSLMRKNAAAIDNYEAPAGGDPLKRLQRTNSKLVQQAQEKNLKVAHVWLFCLFCSRSPRRSDLAATLPRARWPCSIRAVATTLRRAPRAPRVSRIAATPEACLHRSARAAAPLASRPRQCDGCPPRRPRARCCCRRTRRKAIEPEGMAQIEPTRATMRVATFNIRYDTADDAVRGPWAERKHEVVAAFRALDADVVATQEGLLSMLKDLSALLGGEWAWSGKGRDVGGLGEHCALFYRRDRFRLLESGTFWLSETPDQEGSRSWGAACNRIASWIVVGRVGAEHVKTLVLSCHLDHVSAVARKNSCALVVQKTRDLFLWFGCSASVVMGDFNTTPEAEPECAAPFAQSPLRDAIVEAPDCRVGAGTFHNFTGTPVTGRIDWIWLGGFCKAVRVSVYACKQGKYWPSDHFPVWCELKC